MRSTAGEIRRGEMKRDFGGISVCVSNVGSDGAEWLQPAQASVLLNSAGGLQIDLRLCSASTQTRL